SEVVVDYRAEHASGQVRLFQLRHVETKLGPELLRIPEVVFQVDVDEHRSVHACRVGLLAPDALHLEEPLLDLLGYLILDLCHGRSRIKSGHDSLAHVNFRVFAPWHAQKSVNSGCHQHDRECNGDLRVLQGGANRVHRAPPVISTRLPSRTFCCPAMTTCSLPLKPERISTSLPTGRPTSTRRRYTR